MHPPSPAPDVTRQAAPSEQAIDRSRGRARFVWDRADTEGRNVFVWFRRVFEWRGPSAPATPMPLHLFADTCYRLWVNGQVVSYGPARFVPGHAEYDTVDLAPHLKPGRNVVAVEVHRIGATNFQSMPGTPGGFIAWGVLDDGEGNTIDLGTPGAWTARRCAARDALAPAFSFARGPVEVLDTRREVPVWDAPSDDADWRAPVVLAEQAIWGPLSPCTAPPATWREEPPAATLCCASLADHEQRLLVRVHVPGAREARQHGGPRHRFAYATFLHSPREQTVTLGLFWGPHYLNGEPLPTEPDPRLGNRHRTAAHLRAGWNLLCGQLEVLADVWPLLIGLPRDAGLRAAADPDERCRDLLRHTPPMTDLPWPTDAAGAAPADAAALAQLNLPWQRVGPDTIAHAPAREMAWDVPAESAHTNAAHRDDAPADPSAARTWVFDFEREYLGHVIVELDAPAGTVIDVAYDERRRDDGLLDLFRTNPFTDTADRFIARGGPQRIEGYHWRAGRYVQVTLRPPRDATTSDEAVGTSPAPLELRRVAVRSRQAAMPIDGAFTCSDPVLTWAWQLGVETIRASATDVFCDGPWREGGCYLGDLYTQLMAALAFSDDRRLGRRCLRLFAQGQRDDGQMQAVVPSWYQQALEDYTLLFVIQLRDDWARTGELDLVSECWPAIERIWSSPVWRVGREPTGLWTAEGLHVFVDWGAGREATRGDDNAVLNAFRYEALRASADLARALGRAAQAEAFDEQASAVASAFRRVLWRPEVGRFAAARVDGRPVDAASVHGNVLALAFGLADDAQRPSVLRFVLQRMADNPPRALSGANRDDHVELYFLRYVLQALYREDCVAEAEKVMREHFAPMREAGAWCVWEALHRGSRNVGSLCHGWSAAPTQMLTEHTLGVQRTTDPRRVRVAPTAATVTWARGTVPHPLGPIAVAWRREGDALDVSVRAPADVTVDVQPAGPLAHLKLRTSG